MIIYRCDRCKVESSKNHLTTVIIQYGIPPSTPILSGPFYQGLGSGILQQQLGPYKDDLNKYYGLCGYCIANLEEFIKSVKENPNDHS